MRRKRWWSYCYAWSTLGLNILHMLSGKILKIINRKLRMLYLIKKTWRFYGYILNVLNSGSKPVYKYSDLLKLKNYLWWLKCLEWCVSFVTVALKMRHISMNNLKREVCLKFEYPYKKYFKMKMNLWNGKRSGKGSNRLYLNIFIYLYWVYVNVH